MAVSRTPREIAARLELRWQHSCTARRWMGHAPAGSLLRRRRLRVRIKRALLVVAVLVTMGLLVMAAGPAPPSIERLPTLGRPRSRVRRHARGASRYAGRGRQPRRPAAERGRDLSRAARRHPGSAHVDRLRPVLLGGRRAGARDRRRAGRAEPGRGPGQRAARRRRHAGHAGRAGRHAAPQRLSRRVVPATGALERPSPQQPQPPAHPGGGRTRGHHRRLGGQRQVDRQRPARRPLARHRRADRRPRRDVAAGRVHRELARGDGRAARRRGVPPAPAGRRRRTRPGRPQLAGRRQLRGVHHGPAGLRLGPPVHPDDQPLLRPRRPHDRRPDGGGPARRPGRGAHAGKHRPRPGAVGESS